MIDDDAVDRDCHQVLRRRIRIGGEVEKGVSRMDRKRTGRMIGDHGVMISGKKDLLAGIPVTGRRQGAERIRSSILEGSGSAGIWKDLALVAN